MLVVRAAYGRVVVIAASVACLMDIDPRPNMRFDKKLSPFAFGQARLFQPITYYSTTNAARLQSLA